MKRKIKLRRTVITAMAALLTLSSCDYLNVLPPEQVGPEDTMKDEQATLGFLFSCYNAIRLTNALKYESWEASTDEFVEPGVKNRQGQRVAWNQLSSTSYPDYWESLYSYIGQCHLFQREIKQQEPLGMTQETKDAWTVETEFVKAYYHSRLLALYGPIPIINEYPSQNIPTSAMPGRYHYDYVVDYCVNLLDSVAKLLPATRPDAEWGRATKGAALAYKSRILLYAASPLWNGSFPDRDWKNTNFETPGYGKELVSRQYDPHKWERALDAAKEAIRVNENEGGRRLFTVEDAMTLATIQQVPLPYIPGMDENAAATEEERDSIINFKQHVLAMRYLIHSTEADGNKEFIFGLHDTSSQQNVSATSPLRIIYRNSRWTSGFAAVSPTLYTIEHFYTKDGMLPSNDEHFAKQSDWFTSAGVDRPEVIKLHVNREPRFYAWMSFDGDNFSEKMVNGNPLRMNMRSNQAQGYSPTAYNRDYSVTGYHTKKWTQPNINYGSASGDNIKRYIYPEFRLAELYLNAAEAAAALGRNEEALQYLNPIRERAGIPALTMDMVEKSGMSLTDWVRNERFVELWGEGKRYYDVRRWMIAPERLAPAAYEGLNAISKENPTMEEFNQPTRINQQFQWNNRMYMMPISSKEVYSNPQLIQAPGY